MYLFPVASNRVNGLGRDERLRSKQAAVRQAVGGTPEGVPIIRMALTAIMLAVKPMKLLKRWYQEVKWMTIF